MRILWFCALSMSRSCCFFCIPANHLTTSKNTPRQALPEEDMHVIAKSTLLEFADKHPEARDRLLLWHKVMEDCSAHDLNELKLTFNSADYVPKKFTIFDIGGNHYRVIAVIHYNTQKVYIRSVATHGEYDKWTKENRGK